MGENHFATRPVMLYGVILLLCGMAYYILAQVLIAVNGEDSHLARAIGRDAKGIISVVLYLIAVVLAFWLPVGSAVLYGAVAVMWLIPDRRIERGLTSPP